MKKRSLNISGHPTSITLEDEFWLALKDEARGRDMSVNELAAWIDQQRSKENPAPNLSSAIRLFILRSLQGRTPQKN